MRAIFLSLSLLLTLLIPNNIGYVTASGAVKTSSKEVSQKKELPPANTKLTVRLSMATGKNIAFKAQELEVNAEPMDNEIPHLVLKRNGVPTPGFERTLDVSVTDLVVPPSGLNVQLVIETQHGDPDLDRKGNIRIRVSKETRFIPHEAPSQEQVDVQFRVTFNPEMELANKTIKTPTDYYRCRVVISDGQGKQLQTYANDYAFLLENQWRTPLPEVLEATPGAAPNELVVYYYDMMPYQSNLRDPDTRIPRKEVDRYIQTELVPAMVEAFRVQSNTWGFPWYEEWHNFRRDEMPKTLSVALGGRSTWFHGKPASLGHSMISIRVDGTAGEYDNLTDGIMSTFHHELFHNQQRNMSLHFGKHGFVAGKDEAWMMFTEGTAVLASSVAQPVVQFEASAQPRSYLKRANAFLGMEGAIGGGLNKSYKDIPYHMALYWRFLYENCGGVNSQGEDPATGMNVIRRILETLYTGEIVQINFSTDVAAAFPQVIDEALRFTPSCRFDSYEESLIHFARAIYMLRVENGRCQGWLGLSRCGFIDPHELYETPPADTHLVELESPAEIRGSIPSSYGIDLNEFILSPSVDGKTVKLAFTSNTNFATTFHVEVWKTRIIRENGSAEHDLVQVLEPIFTSTEDGHLLLEIKNFDRHEFDGLGLIIVRTDPYEETGAGDYSIQLCAE
jgi:hypothetical protein